LVSTLMIANRLSTFVTSLEFEDLPKSVVEQAKRSLLDTIGVILAGLSSETGKTFTSLAREWGGIKDSTIFGDGLKVPSPIAALVNGTMGHVHELDDGHRFALGHPGITSIPAAFAVAEKSGADGKELITSIVLGYDLFVRVAKAINPSHRRRGFHTTGTCGTFGAAVASGKILHLNEKEIVNTIGIAGIQAAGLMEVMHGDSIIKPLNAGRAASNGTLAALLAEQGISAPNTILEGENGFFRAYSDQYDTDKVVSGLGEHYHIMDTYVKIHASCRHTHPTIDCILNLSKEQELDSGDIEKIIVKTYSTAYKLTGTDYEPRTPSTAKFSIPYCIAVALKYGRVGPDEFTTDKIFDKNLLRLARKVRVKIDPEIEKLVPEKRGASIKIFTKGGGEYEWTVDNPKGEPEKPVSYRELRTKFKTLVNPIIGYYKANKIIKITEKLERIGDINKLNCFLS